MPAPEGYVDVAERIVQFRERFPEGTLKQLSLEFIRDFGGKDWVVYTAAALRTPTDPEPGVGTAWEPVPGPTNFTRDSEVQNAETAAWGRAMVAALAVDTKTIASKQEIQARTSEPIAAPVDEIAVAEWTEARGAAKALKEVQTTWEGAGKAGVTKVASVIKVKEDRKKELA